MSRWFRLYDELLDDPKVQRLPAEDFRGWINLLCLASKNDGRLPSITDIGFALRETQDAVSTLLERLLDGGLIECRSGGADGMHYAPYKWGERQYKSDTSTGRVKRFRERSKTVTETPPDTETEAETEKKEEVGGKPPSYAFFGKVIRLKPRDFSEWKRLFHSIPDIEAELSVLDGWWQEQPEDKRKNWFHASKAMLNKKHQANLKTDRDAEVGPVWDGMP